MTRAAISIAGLHKRYGSVEAVRGVSFEVSSGEILGLLGPNGAGKTTTLECVLGLRRPDSGVIRIDGLDPARAANRVKTRVGALLQGAALQDKITSRQALDLFGSFYPNRFETDELLARFDLEPKADASFHTLSGGERQRLFLALALVNRPAVLILDEPTAGLDPGARRDLRAVMLAMREEGRAILLSTHDIEEAAHLCDRVAIIDAGRVVAIGPPAELAARSSAPAHIVVRTEPVLSRPAVESLPDVAVTACGDRGWRLGTRSPNQVLAALLRLAEDAGADLIDVELRRPTLEDVFLELTGRPWSEESRA